MKDKSKQNYRLIFILDSYDEIKQEYQYKNLYDSNDLEEWGPELKDSKKVFPKIIITCRSEFVSTNKEYRNWFYP